MSIVEHNNIASLPGMVDTVKLDKENPWMSVCIKKDYLKPVTNEAFMMALNPALERASNVHLYFADKRVYILWNGELKDVYKKVRGAVLSVLALPKSGEAQDSMISYFDVHNRSEEFLRFLQKDQALEKATQAKRAPIDAGNDPLGWNTDDSDEGEDSDSPTASLAATSEQVRYFNDLKYQKPYRKNLQVLIVEDDLFFQKLLSEIVRGTKDFRIAPPTVTTAEGLKVAWSVFLNEAPDIIFVDLNLKDGSGHALTRAIKEIDPSTVVIIVTANNYKEEFDVAHQNNVDGFIVKPYNKKQILDYIVKYSSHRGVA